MFIFVIVAVYKVEPYLRECVNSILGQSYSDFELILVDDGSPDRCPSICDEYAVRDCRVRVIHKKNGGLVSARQAGILAAQGEYVVYVDGDDQIFSDMFMRAREIIAEHRPDMIIFSHYVKKGKVLQPVLEPVKEGLYQGLELRKDIYPKLLMDADMDHLSYFLWGKVIRRSILLPHQMAVDVSISLGEDVACIMPVYLEIKSIYISGQVMCLYRFRPLSDSRNFRLEQYEHLIRGVRALDALQPEAVEDFDSQTDRYVIFVCFGLLLSAIDVHGYHMVDQIKRYMKNPALRGHIKRAGFSNITPKTRIAYFLLKRNAVKTAYVFLYLCKQMKERIKL